MKSQNAKDQERLAALRLARTAHIGPVTFRQLLARFGSASVALERVPELAQRGGRKAPFAVASAAAAEDELNALAKLKGRLLCLGDDDYPAALAAIDDAPPVLSMIGHSVLMRRDQIAIVGARNASINGRKMAEKLARDLGLEGFVITSGLARGIDAAAHNAALQSGTVAVVAGGLDVVYPEENKKLYDMICEVGCVVA
ncbi:MAG: DNA-processing protein DprA, partial [Alphaproteobacteria bacterium]|nr:DNA-processing protein DprA [Alphaproteobacteria bacterium]